MEAVMKADENRFAEINEDGIVLRVLKVTQEFIDTGKLGNPENWIKTSKHTQHNQHRVANAERVDKAKGLRNSWLPRSKDDINVLGTPFRGNAASVGGKYDKEHDQFIPPKPYNSWTYSYDKAEWLPPKPCPLKSFDNPDMYIDDETTGGRSIKSEKRDQVQIWKWNEGKQEWIEEVARTKEEKTNMDGEPIPPEHMMTFNVDIDDWVNDVTGEVEYGGWGAKE
tara:strand:+ start:169 stop:840 length:672 start_codon:yes stop_codon:yes gene_type:complete